MERFRFQFFFTRLTIMEVKQKSTLILQYNRHISHTFQSVNRSLSYQINLIVRDIKLLESTLRLTQRKYSDSNLLQYI